jgi:HAD domain in Swiss Army Knife RNA repair proteins
MNKPYLLVDIDGVVSLFGTNAQAVPVSPGRPDGGVATAEGAPIEGAFHAIDGIPHFLSSTAANHLRSLSQSFALVWASGWEEKAEEYLPRLLGVPAGLPFIAFPRPSAGPGRTTSAHWKLQSVSEFVGERPLAWIDDAFNPACHQWAAARRAPTLLVSTSPQRGLTATEAATLLEWARLQAPR